MKLFILIEKIKRIEVRDTLTNKKEFDKYDKLVIATGSSPFTPSTINLKSDRIYTLRNIDDAKRIKDIILNKNVKKAAVIGGGYIGLEICESLRKLNIETHLIEKSDQVLNNLDKEVSSFAKNELIEKGVCLHLSNGLSKIEEMNSHIRIKLEDKTLLDVDLAILALGLKANSLLAKESNLEINERNLIKVNEHMQTSDLDIYAIGDCVATFDYLSHKEKNIALAGISAKEARIAANHIKGIKDSLKKNIPTSIVKVFL